MFVRIVCVRVCGFFICSVWLCVCVCVCVCSVRVCVLCVLVCVVCVEVEQNEWRGRARAQAQAVWPTKWIHQNHTFTPKQAMPRPYVDLHNYEPAGLAIHLLMLSKVLRAGRPSDPFAYHKQSFGLLCAFEPKSICFAWTQATNQVLQPKQPIRKSTWAQTRLLQVKQQTSVGP